MGQAIIIDLLEKSKLPMSYIQIAEKLNDNPIKISKIINTLLKHKEIKCIELDRHQSAKLLDWKVHIRRTRFYYIELDSKELKKWKS